MVFDFYWVLTVPLPRLNIKFIVVLFRSSTVSSVRQDLIVTFWSPSLDSTRPPPLVPVSFGPQVVKRKETFPAPGPGRALRKGGESLDVKND